MDKILWCYHLRPGETASLKELLRSTTYFLGIHQRILNFLYNVFTLEEVKGLKFGLLVFTVEPQSIS